MGKKHLDPIKISLNQREELLKRSRPASRIPVSKISYAPCRAIVKAHGGTIPTILNPAWRNPKEPEHPMGHAAARQHKRTTPSSKSDVGTRCGAEELQAPPQPSGAALASQLQVVVNQNIKGVEPQADLILIGAIAELLGHA